MVELRSFLRLCLIITTIHSQTRGDKNEARVVGGLSAVRDQFPYQVSLKTRAQNFDHSCGGTLVSLNYVLTAAHCVHAGDTEQNPRGTLMKAKDIYAVVGEYSLSKKDDFEQRMAVSKIIPHKDYQISRNSIKNDIALLKLSKPVKFQKQIVEPLAIASPEMESLGLAVASGWGATDGGDDSLPDILQHTLLRILVDCWDESGLTLCTKGDYRSNICYGDAGGPLGCYDYKRGQYFLCGVASYVTPNNCTGSHNANFVKVSEYDTWIDLNTGGEVVPQPHP